LKGGFKLNRSDFIKKIEMTGQVVSGHLRVLDDRVIERWLGDNKWVEDRNSLCMRCKHLEEVKFGFSEEQCKKNIMKGGSCYRETLKTAFIPFLRNVLKGVYPSTQSMIEIIHKKGYINDGIGDFSLIQIVLHELGGTFMKMSAERIQ
jgi:hypothetical protein